MSFKTILVPLSAPESGRSALQTALLVARRSNAHIQAMHVRPDPRGLVPYTGEGMDGSMIEEIMDVTEREGAQRAAQTREAFDDFCREHSLVVSGEPTSDAGVTISWRAETGREDEAVALRGRLHDLIVVGATGRRFSPAVAHYARGGPARHGPSDSRCASRRAGKTRRTHRHRLGSEPGGGARDSGLDTGSCAGRGGDGSVGEYFASAAAPGRRAGGPAEMARRGRQSARFRCGVDRPRTRLSRPDRGGRSRHAGEGGLFAKPSAADGSGGPHPAHPEPRDDSGLAREIGRRTPGRQEGAGVPPVKPPP